MFTTLGKLVRAGTDLVEDTFKAITEIPGDLADGYNEGFTDDKPEDTKEEKSTSNQNGTPPTNRFTTNRN